jgi:hypothetical protein
MSETDYFPALTQVEREFNAHMRQFRSGIETSEDLIYWLHRASVLTLGCISNKSLKRVYTDPAIPSCVLLSQPDEKAQRRGEDEALEKPSDEWVRLKLENQVFTPAFRAAYRKLKTNANEYLDEDSVVSAGSDDAPPALRPALQELSVRQQDALDELFQEGGFDSPAAVSEFKRDLVAATRGHVSGSVLRSMTGDGNGGGNVLYSAILGPGEYEATSPLVEPKEDECLRLRLLRSFTANHLLAPFNEAVRDLAATAGEQAETGSQSSGDTLNV